MLALRINSAAKIRPYPFFLSGRGHEPLFRWPNEVDNVLVGTFSYYCYSINTVMYLALLFV